MHRLFLAGLLALCCSASAHAQVSDLVWRIEVDGTLSLTNPTASAIWFDGYTLGCEAGCLDAANWVQLGASALADPGKAIATLGAGSLSFGPLGTLDSTTQLTEANLAASATLQPGGSWSFGKPFSGTPTQLFEWACQDGSLSISMSGQGADGGLGNLLICIPEPSAAGLAGIAVIGVLVGVRRRNRGNES